MSCPARARARATPSLSSSRMAWARRSAARTGELVHARLHEAAIHCSPNSAVAVRTARDTVLRCTPIESARALWLRNTPAPIMAFIARRFSSGEMPSVHSFSPCMNRRAFGIRQRRVTNLRRHCTPARRHASRRRMPKIASTRWLSPGGRRRARPSCCWPSRRIESASAVSDSSSSRTAGGCGSATASPGRGRRPRR